MAAEIPEAAAVADIGSGDGLLAAHLARLNPDRRVIATENKAGPYEVVRAAVRALAVDVRLGDGLAVLAPGEVDVIVIAGMGGHRILGLMDRAPEVVAAASRLVLQPMQHLPRLVDGLDSRGFLVERLASVTQAGRVHTVLVVVPPYSRTDAAD